MSGVLPTWQRALALADRLDAERVASGRDPCGPAPLPAVWAAAKLACTALVSPLLGAWVLTRAGLNHRRMVSLVDRFPALLDEVLAGREAGYPLARVARVDAGARWFVSSDLHRGPPGRQDWPARQGTRVLYEAALDHYASGGWGLIENGDIEDYWLVGGSVYGIVYDLARMVAAALPGEQGRALRRAVHTEHLQRIVAHYRSTVERVRDGFHRHGRFVRVAGNHDDIYEDPTVAGALARVYPGLSVVDAVVLQAGDVPVGLVLHGHQTDAWNSPVVPNLVARFTTSLAAALHDQPVESLAPGLPGPEISRGLLAGRVRNQLTRVNGLTGATLGLDSLDEVLLFEACRRRWGRPGAADLDEGPWLILGHTHIPLAAPDHPGGIGRWARYVNGGSGITHRLVSGVEWDGSQSPARPEVSLVAWIPSRDGARRQVLRTAEAGDAAPALSPAGPIRRDGGPPRTSPGLR